MRLARQDQGAPTKAGVGSPLRRCNAELDRNPPAPKGFRTAQGRLLCWRCFPGGAFPCAPRTPSLLPRLMQGCVAPPCMRPCGARNPAPPTLTTGCSGLGSRPTDCVHGVNMKMKRIAVLSGVLLSVAPLLLAQKQDGSIVRKVDVVVRTVTAVITDDKGLPLGADPLPGDLELLEDGQRCEIVGVDRVQTDGSAAGNTVLATADPAAPPSRRAAGTASVVAAPSALSSPTNRP